jgi:methylase of polypeptide subunit release factors
MTLVPPEPALVALLAELGRAGYSFTAVTPATHARVVARPEREEARDLRDVFGWSLRFASGFLPPAIAEALASAGAVERHGSRLKSRLRVASLGGDLFLHSAFPTSADDSVFFGPDTYRYAALLGAELPALGPVRRLVDVGAGGGAGGIVAARLLPGARITLADLNPAALRLAAANAAHAGVEVERTLGAGLEPVTGAIDCVIANPPFMMDEEGRAYRSGGGLGGAALSLDWTLAAAARLEPGGHMILYTGVAMAGDDDPLREALAKALPPLGCTLSYRELDPDIFGEELDRAPYREIERIAAVAAVIAKGG